ncbi:MAG: polyphenol oxidase family protein [Acidimicrobiales bacterium]
MRPLVGHFRFTDCDDGDLAIRTVGVEQRRTRVVDLPWTWLNQVHGSAVVVVNHPGDHVGANADAAVTTSAGIALAVQTADCAPIALVGSGSVGVVHAGWRGLVEGIVENTVSALSGISSGPLQAVLGPCIHAECYEFGDHDLEKLVRHFGDEIRGETRSGTQSLNLPVAVKIALVRSGVETIDDVSSCTACSSRHWSYRARGDSKRHAVVAWLEQPSNDDRGS